MIFYVSVFTRTIVSFELINLSMCSPYVLLETLQILSKLNVAKLTE